MVQCVYGVGTMALDNLKACYNLTNHYNSSYITDCTDCVNLASIDPFGVLSIIL